MVALVGIVSIVVVLAGIFYLRKRGK
jgi:hypothetical protein